MSTATASLHHPSSVPARPTLVPAPAPLVAVPALRPERALAPAGRALVAKHAIDLLVAVVALLVLLPVLIGLALAVKATSAGPVLYRQRRIGRDGRAFDILKFRSMRVDAPHGAFALAAGSAPGGVEGVDRRTPIGRLLRATSLDELPQLLNVLRGEMSIVGPRPERPEFVELFADEIPGYADRHRMRVGMTGLAQVRGLRGQCSIAERAAADNEYIDHWTLRQDLAVMLRTIRVVIAGDAE